VSSQDYCEQSPNEISVQAQSLYCNDNLSSNHRHIYVKSEQVKQREELEREKKKLYKIQDRRSFALSLLK
jgi:hypothetical protein